MALRVLVVDDSPDALHAMNMLIRSFGHEVRTAKDGRTALELAKAFRPHFVFMDIKLPDINGYEVARRLKGDATLDGIRIFALTGIPGDDFRSISRSEGFEGHYAKPLDPAVLEDLLGPGR